MNAQSLASRVRLAICVSAIFFELLLGAIAANAESPKEWVKTEANELTQLYKSLHQAPELSYEEEKTAARMAGQLRELGFEATERVGGHGVVGLLKNGDGPTLLLRADMDALPVVEETGLD